MLKIFNKNSGTLIPFILVVLFFSYLNPQFFSVSTGTIILNSAAELGIMVLGVSLLMIAGEFDLSVGANLACSGMVFGSLISFEVSGITAFLLTLLLGAVIGLINGLITLILKIPSFIGTLGMMLILRSMLLLFSGGLPLVLDVKNPVIDILSGALASNILSASLWWFGLAFYCSFLLDWTRFGNHLYATGNHIENAFLQGVGTKQVKLICFVLCGIFSSLAGMIQMGHIKSIGPNAGDQYELFAVTAAVLGGVSLKGGKGGILGACLGALLMSTVDSGLVYIGVSSYWYRASVGCLLIVSVAINSVLKRGLS